jgi:hypothetical protein
MELIEARRIWARAPHNAFTDLIRFGGHWYCAFREGESHVSDDGRLRVIRSEDGEEWSSAALMEWEGGDVRDAKLSVTADGQLMLSGAVRFLQPVDGNRHQSVSWLSENGTDWSEPHACTTGLGTWRWSTTWHGQYGYSFGYSGKDPALCLYRTSEGKNWEVVKDEVFPDPESYPNETSLVFLPDHTAYCLLRRDKGSCTAMLGKARPPYEEWEWTDLGTRIGGPKMIRLEEGRLLATVRLYDGKTRTSVCGVDPEESTITEALKLPSGGDTSYAGMVQRGDTVWISYYSSHKGKTAIYLGKIVITR